MLETCLQSDLNFLNWHFLLSDDIKLANTCISVYFLKNWDAGSVMNHRVEAVSNCILRHLKTVRVKVAPAFTVSNSFVTVSQQLSQPGLGLFMLILRKGPCSLLMYKLKWFTHLSFSGKWPSLEPINCRTESDLCDGVCTECLEMIHSRRKIWICEKYLIHWYFKQLAAIVYIYKIKRITLLWI